MLKHIIKLRVYNREENIKLAYTVSKMIVQSPLASVLTPLIGVSNQDWCLHNDIKPN